MSPRVGSRPHSPSPTYPAAFGDADELGQVGLSCAPGGLRGAGGIARILLAPVQGPGEAWGGEEEEEEDGCTTPKSPHPGGDFGGGAHLAPAMPQWGRIRTWCWGLETGRSARPPALKPPPRRRRRKKRVPPPRCPRLGKGALGAAVSVPHPTHIISFFFGGGHQPCAHPCANTGHPRVGARPGVPPPCTSCWGPTASWCWKRGGDTHGDGVPRLGEGAGGARSLLG